MKLETKNQFKYKIEQFRIEGKISNLQGRQNCDDMQNLSLKIKTKLARRYCRAGHVI